ncbi:esterase [Mangrovimonas yunxiaonensis]|uniref:Esterase n=1 Tax=Mangrovimonas yunxiaonensis TaxID=1197477 RepID=A0A084TL36_9FLAO|nr:alpha/beta hydrolase-fold protein [Mangrovimonas yunxiaonensis]KFB01422.1 esterase [Mangrovimonas yunxiaonensis]GGH36738.1 histidine kinase [Mangrovimonas yunxiaonensis]
MKKIHLLLLLFFTVQIAFSQVDYKTIFSEKLGEERELKIQLPRGYADSDNKRYPLIVVFDGDYLFEPVAGNVDYYSYWDDMPEAIVVGINQLDKRYDDSLYSEQNSLPIETGVSFFEFVGMELMPYLEKNYRIENFKMAIGHGETANFINYYLLKGEPLFQGYVVLSPDLAPDMLNYIPEKLQKVQSKIFYYLASSKNDINHIKAATVSLNAEIGKLENKNILYNYFDFENPTHYAVPAYAIPDALMKIFLVYQPISKNEYKETILKLQSSPVVYLEEKYQTIKDLFGIEKQILVNDFKAISAAIEKNEQFQHYEALGKLARKAYPDAILGSYYLARFYEETGEPKKAMKTYQSAYVLEELGGITKDLVLEKAEEIKADFGY